MRSSAGEETQPKLGARAQAKAQTRQRLIDAGKRLFMERGYEGATIRDIAASVGLSTGAVFVSFLDKIDFFNEILLTDEKTQVERMTAAAAEGGSLQERLVRALAAGYAYQLEQIELMRAAIGASWSPGLSGQLGDQPLRDGTVRTIHEILAQAAAQGVALDDIDLLSETIWNCFLGNYRHAFFAGKGLEWLTRRLDQQIALILPRA